MSTGAILSAYSPKSPLRTDIHRRDAQDDPRGGAMRWMPREATLIFHRQDWTHWHWVGANGTTICRKQVDLEMVPAGTLVQYSLDKVTCMICKRGVARLAAARKVIASGSLGRRGWAAGPTVVDGWPTWIHPEGGRVCLDAGGWWCPCSLDGNLLPITSKKKGEGVYKRYEDPLKAMRVARAAVAGRR